jgi:EAL domain-containing protein (putative c-di-GMP-specific phosphodiesterase class I)/GGDEF domain-containing protein
MKKEQSHKRLLTQVVLISALSIIAALFFLFSIRGLLLAEAESRMLSHNYKYVNLLKDNEEFYATQDSNFSQEVVTLDDNYTTTDFDGQISSFLVDSVGNVLITFGKNANEVSNQNENFLGQFLSDVIEAEYNDKLQSGDGFVKKYRLSSGESWFMAVRQTEVIANGYVVSIVPVAIVDDEIASIWNIAIVIIVLAIISILLGVFYSVYNKKFNNRRMSRNGKPDTVTGLPHYMVHKLKSQQLMNQELDTYAYVSFSIDKFNLISELSGKEYCDYLLKAVADILSNWVKKDETFARVHDDLFGMLLKYDEELKFRQRLIRMFKHAGDIPITENNFCNITFHGGVCLVEKELDIDKVITRAKKARGNVGVGSIANINFYQGRSAGNNNNEQIAKEAAQALYDERFLVYLQPKYRLESEKIAGAEALIRWNHPSYGLLTPNVFLPLLEENGMITQIDFYVLETVCKFIRDWLRDEKKAVPVSVNLSARHLENHLFIQKLLEIVDSYEIPHELIEFEFPENAVYDTRNELLEAMKQLQQLGFIISIDNFGAGLSAVQLLKELPIHILKIDKGLIKDFEDIEFSDKDRTIVTHIISYAKSMNMEVLVEGVETQGQKEMLQAQACDMIQGYYYQKPMPPQEFERLLEA